MLADVKILGQREKFDFLPGGRTTKGVETTFNVGPDGPFTVFLSDDAFTAAANLAAIEQKADTVRAVRTQHAEQAK